MPTTERELIRARAEAVFRPAHLSVVPAILGPISRTNPKAVWSDIGTFQGKLGQTVRVERRGRKATVH